MSHQDGMEMNRRDFVTGAAAAAVGIGILAAAGGSAMAQDAATQPAAETLDVGVKTDYAKDGPVSTWVMDHHIVVARENGKIYAMTSKCTHKGCDVADDSMQLSCPCHGSTFSYDGKVTMGPARRTLPRYGISVNGDGHLIVDKGKTFDDTQWDDPASFVSVS
jgi:Rieske Fe-S protein